MRMQFYLNGKAAKLPELFKQEGGMAVDWMIKEALRIHHQTDSGEYRFHLWNKSKKLNSDVLLVKVNWTAAKARTHRTSGPALSTSVCRTGWIEKSS